MGNTTDRVFVRNNILDRLTDLESKLREIQDYSLTPQAAGQNPEQPTWNQVSGWITTGTQFRDTAGHIVLDSVEPAITIAVGGHIRSSDFLTGTSGFDINGGVAEFNDVTVRGTIIATVGSIGGWTIGAAALTGGDVTLHSTGYLLLGTGNDVARIDAADANYRLWIGNAVAANAPFSVTKAGAMASTSGVIGGWTIGANSLVAGSGANRVGLDSAGVNPAIYAGSETPASAPFQVSKTGVLTATGAMIQSAVSGARTVLDSTGIKGYDAGAVQRYELLNDGSGWMGSSSVLSWTAAGVVSVNGSAVVSNTITSVKVSFANCPLITDLVTHNNSPWANYLEWDSFTLTYEGVNYTIEASYTPHKYIWWDKAISTTVLQASATPPSPAANQFLVMLNIMGSVSLTPFANFVYADYIVAANLSDIQTKLGDVYADAGHFIEAKTDGNTGGYKAGAGSDVLLYRGAVDTWRTPDNFISDALIKGSQLQSTVATGTAPIVVASTTVCANLNVSALQGNAALAFAVAAKGVTNGDTHDHVGGDGAQISHTGLSNIGTNTHAAIDTFIGYGRLLPFSSYGCLAENITASLAYPFACTVPQALTIIEWDQFVYVATTNDSNNYWAITLTRWDTGATLDTFSTNTYSPNTGYRSARALNISVTVAMLGMDIKVVKMGYPGALYLKGPCVKAS